MVVKRFWSVNNQQQLYTFVIIWRPLLFLLCTVYLVWYQGQWRTAESGTHSVNMVKVSISFLTISVWIVVSGQSTIGWVTKLISLHNLNRSMNLWIGVHVSNTSSFTVDHLTSTRRHSHFGPKEFKYYKTTADNAQQASTWKPLCIIANTNAMRNEGKSRKEKKRKPNTKTKSFHFQTRKNTQTMENKTWNVYSTNKRNGKK